MPRTLNDIIPPSRRKQMEEEGTLPPGASFEPRSPLPPERPQRPVYGTPAPRRFPYVTAAIAVVIIGLSVAALYLFSGAEVTIDPSTEAVTVSGSYSATATGTLPFQIVSVQKIGSQAVTGSGSETVNTPAQGTITIYNTQSTDQPLVANTRFETPAGLVFRIHSSIDVPAAGSDGTPGSLSATVYADSAGDSYNVGPTTFTVPGLSGSDAFTAVTAKSTTAMTGGFSGTEPQVDQATETGAQSALKTALEPDLQSEIKGQVPSGYALLPGAVTTSYEDLPSTTDANGTSVDVREQGTATAVVFPTAALASAIAAETVASYNGEPVTIPDTSDLALTAAGGLPSAGDQSFDFTLSGTATIVWTVDPNRIASAVAGKTRDSAQVVLSGFPEVKRALLVLRPFWADTFPADPADIKIVVNPPSGN